MPPWQTSKEEQQFLVRTLGLMSPCPPLRLNISIECKRVSGLEPATVDWAFDLTKTNMQTM